MAKQNKNTGKGALVISNEKAISNNDMLKTTVNNCIIPEGMKPAIRISENFTYQLMHKHNINIAYAETMQSLHEKNMQSIRNEVCKSNANLAFHSEYKQTIEREQAIKEKMLIIGIACSTIGITMTENELRNKAVQSLGIVPLTATITRTRTSSRVNQVNQVNPLSGTTDNNLINRICLEYAGAPIGSLPIDVKGLFNRTTARKYSAISCYYQQLATKTGSGIIADSIRKYDDLNQVIPALQQTTLHDTTISRFREALRLYQSRPI